MGLLRFQIDYISHNLHSKFTFFKFNFNFCVWHICLYECIPMCVASHVLLCSSMEVHVEADVDVDALT